ncbi:MAG: hypothetical protein ACRDH0_00520 [Actinomycetota bacterium]
MTTFLVAGGPDATVKVTGSDFTPLLSEYEPNVSDEMLYVVRLPGICAPGGSELSVGMGQFVALPQPVMLAQGSGAGELIVRS